MAGMPNANPIITLQMNLDTFNVVQGILAKRKFEKVADLILGFRAQVQTQIEALRRQEAASRDASPTRLRAVPEASPEVVTDEHTG